MEQTARKIQATLSAINAGQKIFFNIAQYEKAGLTYSRKVWGVNSAGNKEVMGHTHHLTDKGKQFISFII